jgi:hypothetical protein
MHVRAGAGLGGEAEAADTGPASTVGDTELADTPRELDGEEAGPVAGGKGGAGV